MSTFVGFDTSNYTTSLAAYTPAENRLEQKKRLLTVKEGEMGLRQSDALFQHVRELPHLAADFLPSVSRPIGAIGVSTRPTQQDGSYMPCFLAGQSVAETTAAALGVPCFSFSHQQGHVTAALYGTGHLDWLDRPFLAFHVSGGTTDALLIEPDNQEIIRCRLVARSLDLKAGQLVDRVGGLLGLSFPAGPALEQLALRSTAAFSPRIPTEEGNCHLSGVENQCRRLLEQQTPPEDVALFCLLSIEAALTKMTEHLFRTIGELPLLYAGGVMSNSLIRDHLSARFGGEFAPPAFSADNAAGIAVLTSLSV